MDKVYSLGDTSLRSGSKAQILPLSLENVSFEAGGVRLIKDMSVEFRAAPRTIILGPNGAGKTLLLRLCHGLLTPSAGRIVWRGPMGNNPSRFQTMVFQRPVLLRRSVAGNIRFGLKCRGVARAERNRIVEEVLELTGLGRLAKEPARSLSGGEQQRLSLARAWALKPEVLFLDEPTANLDPAATHSLEKIIETISHHGTKIVMATHDLPQARRLAEDILFLYRGRLLEQASAGPFFDRPKNDLAQAFLRGELLWWHRKELTPQSRRGKERTDIAP